MSGATGDALKRFLAELGLGVAHEPDHRGTFAVLDNGLADAIGNHLAAGDGDAVLFRLLGDDLDEVVVAQDVREFEQRLGDLDLVVGELDHHVARCPVQRRQQLGHMGPRLGFHQFGELAQHLVVLRDLLVVAAIRHIGVKLGHVAEQLFAFHDVRIPVQHPERREGFGRALFHLCHVTSLRLLPTCWQIDP